MAGYFIPRRTRIKTIFLKGLTAGDLIWLIIGAIGVVGLFLSRLIPLMILGGVVALVLIIGMFKDSAGDRKYESFVWYFRFLAYSKKYAKIEAR